LFREAFEEVKRKIERYNEKREIMIKKLRDVLRLSREAISKIHMGRRKEAESLLLESKNIIDEIHALAKEEPKLIFSGIFIDIAKEFVEAVLLLQIINRLANKTDIPIPSSNNLGVPDEAWILGLCEVTGELKREILIALGKQDISLSYKLLNVIREIYDLVASLSFPGSIIPHLKAKIDYVRSILISSEELIVRLKSEREILRELKNLSEKK